MMKMMNTLAGRPETEVTEKAKRRRFTAEYKQRIVREAAACKEPGAVGSLLRREVVLISPTHWRKEAARGELTALKPKRRGPEPKPINVHERELREAHREIVRLKKRAERAEALVEVQKKVSQLLGIALPTIEDEES
jgi:transposase